MPIPRLILLAGIASICAIARAGVVIEPVSTDATLRDAVTIVAERADDAQVSTTTATIGGRATLELTRGVWLVRARAAGIWSPTVVADVRETALPPLRLPIVRSGIVRMKVAPRTKELAIYFRFDGTEESVPCALDEDSAMCELPAGVHDLAIRMPGFVTRYEWSRTVPADLGTLRFQRGTTITGWVDLSGSGLRDFSGIEVTLTRDDGGRLNEEQKLRVSLADVRAKPNDRGFFQLVTSPGQYILQARGKGLRSDEIEIAAIDGKETIVRDALLLQRGQALTVHIEPNVDPTGTPWTVTLDEQKRVASAEGVAVFDDLLPSTYRLSVGRASDDSWQAQTIDTRIASEVTIQLALRKVRGRVLLNTKGLRARLEFSDDEHSIRTRSIADGRFAVYLPLGEAKTWKRVAIEADEPRVRAAVEDVAIDEDGELTIDLPEHAVSGEIVDELGRSVPHAMVTIQTANDTYQLESDAGGFTLTGLPAGTVTFTAFTVDRETASPVTVQFGDDVEHVETVRLVVSPGTTLRGVIESLHGPVMSARVWAPPSTLRGVLVPLSSDVDGTFRVELPPATREVPFFVSAPGYAFRALRLPVKRESQQVFLSDAGGALRVDAAISPERKPYLMHDGVILTAASFAFVARARDLHFTESRIAFDAPLVEEGTWSLCSFTPQEAMAAEGGMVDAARCATTRVGRGSVATLALSGEGHRSYSSTTHARSSRQLFQR